MVREEREYNYNKADRLATNSEPHGTNQIGDFP